MPRMGVCAMSFMLSSLCSAVLKGRNQLFETMKRDGAGSLENVVTSSQGHKAQTPNTVPIRSFAKDRIGNSLAHVRYIRVRTHKQPVMPTTTCSGGFNGWAQHFNLLGKMEC